MAKRLKRKKFYTYDGGIKNGENLPTTIGGLINSKLNLFNPNSNLNINISSKNNKRNNKLDLNKYSKVEVKKQRLLSKENQVKHPESGQPIDWAKLDQLGKPAITFNPSRAEHKKMVHLFTLDKRRLPAAEKKLRQAVERKLEQEFIRLYERYRRAAMREKGWTSVAYGVMEKERKYALSAATACIVKGVTPRQVFEYWHKNIGHFVNNKMAVPSLPFLSQPANIDEVYINLMQEKYSSRNPSRRHNNKPRSMHTMSDTSLLDPCFRAALAGAGFDLAEINNTYLSAIQAYAIDVVSGQTKPQHIPSKLRPMVKWAAENFFVDKDLDDYI